MNGYPPYSSAPPSGQQQNQFSDPRLPPRPVVPPPPAQQPYPPQNRNSSDYPSFPPPVLPSYQSGPPPQHHAGPSRYMNEPPGREPHYDSGNGYPPRDGNQDPYSQGPVAGYQNGPAQNQRPPAQNGSGYGQEHRRPDAVPVLPPMRFADRPPQFPPHSGDRGPQGQGAPPYQGQDYGSSAPRDYDSIGQYPRQDGGRDNFRGNGDQQGRARSPDRELHFLILN